MMKSSAFLCAVIILIMASCTNFSLASKTVNASGSDLTRSIKVDNISKIDVSQAIVVNYTVGSPVSVKYTVPESIERYLDITCKNGTLKCKLQSDISINLNGRQIVVDVTAPNINDFEASVSAKINVSGVLSVRKLEAEASSSASINIANVKTATADIESSSAGNVRIKELISSSVDIDASSSSHIDISGALGKVNVEASSSADVMLVGSCDFMIVEASSASSVDASQAKIPTGTLKASSGASITVSPSSASPYKTTTSTGGSINIR